MDILILQKTDKSLSKVAWDLSRHVDGTSVEEINRIDAPVNDIPSVVLNIRSTLIEREVFSSMRDHVMWARTSRVDDIMKFEIDEIFSEHNEIYEMLRVQMAETDRQDEYRMFLPLVALTSYTIRISYRSLVKVKDYFGELSRSDEALNVKLFGEAERTLKLVLNEIDFNEVEYKKINIFPGILNRGTGMIGDVFTLTITVPFALRAQIVRARLLSVTDSLFHVLIPALRFATQGTMMEVQVSGTRSVWKTLLSKRSCWLAQADLWAQIVMEVSEAYEFNEEILPCSDGTCPYASDADLRLTDKDPGAPCPRYCELNDIKVNIHQINKIRSQMHNEKRSEYWREML